MTGRVIPSAFAVALAAWAPSAHPQSSDVLRQLDRKCEQERDVALPAIRQQKIEACVGQAPSARSARARPPSREQCERYWSDYGVIQRQRAALDLPECRKAFEARQQYRSR